MHSVPPRDSLRFNPRCTERAFVAQYGGRTASTPPHLEGLGQVGRVRVSVLRAGVLRIPEASVSASAEPSKRPRTTAAACCHCVTRPDGTRPLGFRHVQFAHRTSAALCGRGTASTPSHDSGWPAHLPPPTPFQVSTAPSGGTSNARPFGHRLSSRPSTERGGLSPRGFAHLKLRVCCRTARAVIFTVLRLPE